MFSAHTKITNLKARVEELTKSEADFKERYEKAKSHREHVEGESLEIDLTAERVKAESAEEARKVSQAALNVAQDNYAEVQATIEPLINNLDWLQNYGIAHIMNSILNSIELDRAVAALTVASRVVGHCAGDVECTQHVETAFDAQWGTCHCSVNEQTEEGLRKAEENYDNLSLFVMDLVSEALKHDVYVARLKAIFEPPETVE
ncbi:hypothetical protein Hanom_Chr16g01472391 [Helianthus anomalus]